MNKILFIIVFYCFSFSAFTQENQKAVFFTAIKNNNTSIVKNILENNKTYLDSTISESALFRNVVINPLNQALMYSDIKTIEMLLDYGADPQKSMQESGFMSSKQVSSLEILVMHKDLEIIRYLFPKLNVNKISFCNALLVASDNKKTEIVKFLLSKGEEVLLK